MQVPVDVTVSAETRVKPVQWPVGVEAITVAVIFCVATIAGVMAVRSFRAAGGAEYFYQSDFGAAVMLACGRGFQDPDTTHAPALAAFLAQQSNALDCADIPPTTPTSAPTAFQNSMRYLEIAVALTWKLTGLSWSRLAILNGVLFGAVAALSYGILRLAMSRLLAIVGVVLTVTCTPNVMLVPQLRDYAKGPFLLAIILIAGVLVLACADSKRVLAWSALAGGVVGLGLGFRMDLAIAIVPFFIAVGLLLPSAVRVRARIGALAVFLLCLAIVAFPVLRHQRNSSNTGHVALLGLMSDFDGPLRIAPAVYSYGGPYVDSLAATTINAYAIRVGQPPAVEGISPQYERNAMSYLSRIATTFPADVVTRVATASKTITKYFLDSSLYPPVQVQSSNVLSNLYVLRGRQLWRLGRIAFLAFVIATVLVSAVNLRAAILAIVVLVGFAGASALQFNERHFFYLQFVPWFVFGLLLQTALNRRRWLDALTRRDVTRALTFATVALAVCGGAILLSGSIQQRIATPLFYRYESAPRSPIQTMKMPAGTGRTLIAAPEWLQPLPAGTPKFATRFLAVQFRDDSCGVASVPVTIRYDGRRRDADLSEQVTAKLRPGSTTPTMLFVAAYDWADDYVRFRGFEVRDSDAGCVGGVFNVHGLEREPLLLTTTLRAGWRGEPLYQRFR